MNDAELRRLYVRHELATTGLVMSDWRRIASEVAAIERERLQDCRLCTRHTTASGGCVSALRCVGGDRFQPTQPRQLWEAPPPDPAPF